MTNDDCIPQLGNPGRKLLVTTAVAGVFLALIGWISPQHASPLEKQNQAFALMPADGNGTLEATNSNSCKPGQRRGAAALTIGGHVQGEASVASNSQRAPGGSSANSH